MVLRKGHNSSLKVIAGSIKRSCKEDTMKQKLVLGILCAIILTVESLTCLEKNLTDCKPPENCQFGVVPDVCAQCKVCANSLGEDCGGLWGMGGTCGDQFKCTNPAHSTGDKDPKPGKCVNP